MFVRIPASLANPSISLSTFLRFEASASRQRKGCRVAHAGCVTGDPAAAAATRVAMQNGRAAMAQWMWKRSATRLGLGLGFGRGSSGNGFLLASRALDVIRISNPQAHFQSWNRHSTRNANWVEICRHLRCTLTPFQSRVCCAQEEESRILGFAIVSPVENADCAMRHPKQCFWAVLVVEKELWGCVNVH